MPARLVSLATGATNLFPGRRSPEVREGGRDEQDLTLGGHRQAGVGFLNGKIGDAIAEKILPVPAHCG